MTTIAAAGAGAAAETSKTPDATQTSKITGGCLCGAVRYELSPDPTPVYSVICHCENCKKASGTHMVNATIYSKKIFQVTAGSPQAYADRDTDSMEPLYRHFCARCGSNLFVFTPLDDDIVSVFSGSMDEVYRNAWRPNIEQYMDTKSMWLPDFTLKPKEGLQERYGRCR